MDIELRISKYIPNRMFGFCGTEQNPNEVFFHLASFVSGPSKIPPILGERVLVSMDISQGQINVAPKAIQVVRCEEPIVLEGVVESFDYVRGFGFIRGVDGIVYHLHRSEFVYSRDPDVGSRVMFVAGTRQDKPRACHIKVNS